MKSIDPVIINSIADLFINLSTGWFAALLIAPNFTKKKGVEKLIVLTLDIVFAIVFLGVAIYLRKLL